MDEARAIKAARRWQKSDIRVFQVGYNRRFDKSYLAMKEKVAAGYIGTPVLVKMINRDPAVALGIHHQVRAHVRRARVRYAHARLRRGALVSGYGRGNASMASAACTPTKASARWGISTTAAFSAASAAARWAGLKPRAAAPTATRLKRRFLVPKGCLRVCTTPSNDRVVSLDKGGIHQSALSMVLRILGADVHGGTAGVLSRPWKRENPRWMGAGLMDGYKAVEWALAAKRAVDEESVVRI